MKTLFNELLYQPLYNILIGLIDVLPNADIGFAVILLTVFVKIVLFPLSKKSIKTQLLMKDIEPEIKELKIKYKDNQQELAQKTLQLYREKGVNPFAGIFLVLIQLPVIIALYLVFSKAGLPSIKPELLYSFIDIPNNAQTVFLGFINLISNKNILVAFLVLITQSIQIRLSLPKQTDSNSPDSQFAQEIMKSMHFQMKYILPIITAIAAYSLISVIGLYWITSNIFAIFQELYLKKTIKKN